MIFFSVNSSKENIFVREKQGVVIEVSHSFAAYTGYRIDDLVNKSIKDIFSLLKIGPNNDDGIDVKDFRFLFTKSQEVKFISIRLEKSANENIYIINEVNDNQLEDKFSYLYCQIADNTAPLLILSVPDFTLIKASQMILDAFDAPFNTPENAFGRKLNKYIDGWTESISEDIWKEIMHNGRSKRIKEGMHAQRL